MKWPWRKRQAEAVKHRREAQRRFEEVVADWPTIRAAVAPIQEGARRNHITARAFALKEKGAQ